MQFLGVFQLLCSLLRQFMKVDTPAVGRKFKVEGLCSFWVSITQEWNIYTLNIKTKGKWSTDDEYLYFLTMVYTSQKVHKKVVFFQQIFWPHWWKMSIWLWESVSKSIPWCHAHPHPVLENSCMEVAIVWCKPFNLLFEVLTKSTLLGRDGQYIDIIVYRNIESPQLLHRGGFTIIVILSSHYIAFT